MRLERTEILNRFRYDRQNGVLIWENPSKFNPSLRGKRAGCIDPRGYNVIHFNSGNDFLFVHQIVWFLEKGNWPKEIDHIDGNRSNNRIENLREVTTRENNQNRHCHRNGKLVGATWNKKEQTWRSQIWHNGRKIHLGRFKTENEAHLKYIETLKVLT